MALRSPIFLDSDTLLAQAEYHDIAVPRQAEIVEKSVRQRSAGGKAGTNTINVRGSRGSNVEYQSSYTLTPSSKATVSKIIDQLLANDAVKAAPDGETTLAKDDLVELDGITRIAAASLAGKMFFVVRRLVEDPDVELASITDLDIDDLPVGEQLKQVYLQNELLPIPILLEMTGTAMPQQVYINVRPDHFVDAASSSCVEGELRVLGSISHLIDDSGDGYLSAVDWLLSGWEYLMRRRLMTEVEELVQDLVKQMELDLPAKDVHGHIAGPAVVVDAIAMY